MSSERAGNTGFTNEPDFKLGDWWVRPQRNELERGDEIAHVEARSMEVLVCLARHAPRVVGKQRLLDEVWSDSHFVGDEVISHAIWELRRVLGDSARDPSYIKTVPRKGYVLLADVVRPQGALVPFEGVRIDHYDIQEEIGRGSMGVVFKALDRRLERTVAIKFLAPELTRDREACRRFQREARVAASLDHPNLVTIHAIGETAEGQHYLVTPFYSGGSLKEVCARGELSIEGVVGFARQLARGLAAAHSQGIVHRDIKPANLLVDEHGTLKIADFGIAKLLGATDLTHTGVSLGTPAYKSPEQAQGRPVDHRSDIWSFGVVLFELLTGRRPFDGEYELAVVHSILSSEPAAETDLRGTPIPDALRRIVAKAMAKEPDERYQNAEEVAEELEAVDRGASGAVPAAAPRPRDAARPRRLAATRWPRSRPARLTLGTAVLIGLLVAGYLAWTLLVPRSSGSLAIEIRKALAQVTSNWMRGNDAKNIEDVRQQLSEIARRAPDRADVLGAYALFLADAFGARSEERAQVEKLIQRVRELDSKSALAWSAEARLRWQDGAFEEAAAAARKAIDINPTCDLGENCDLAYVWLADALWGLGRRDEAIKAVTDGLDKAGTRIRCLLKRAQLLGQLGRREDAIAAYEEVLKLDPTQSTALNELGLLFMDGRRFEEAASLFERLYARTGEPRALYNQGNAFYELKRWHDARRTYQDALAQYLAHGIRSPQPMIALGDTYSELREPDSARENYQMALSVFDELLTNPNASIADRARRAVCLAKLGRLDEARAALPSLLEHESTFSTVLVYAAKVAALAGDRRALLDWSRRAIEAGHTVYELTADSAFLALRSDPEYRANLERSPPPPTTPSQAGGA